MAPEAPPQTPEQQKRSKQEQDALKRKILFVPCRSKEALHKWIKLFLNLDIPDCIVDPDSNCSPMDMIYECYSKAMHNDDPLFSRVLYYASRDSFKTLGAAILEVLAVVHLQRDVAHMAAIEAQSRKSQQYVKKFFSKPILRDYVSGDNLEIMWVKRFYNKATGENLTEDRWKTLPSESKDDYEEIAHFIHIVICTMAGANCVDLGADVTMADGSTKIAASVKPGDVVLSFDTGTQEFVPNVVESVGVITKPRMEVVTQDGGGLILSEDHAMLGESGWHYSRALRLGEDLIDSERPVSDASCCVVASTQVVENPWSVLYGTLLGDTSVTWPKKRAGDKYGRGPRIQFYHCNDQVEYARSKAIALRGIGVNTSETSSRDGIKVCSSTSKSLASVYELCYPDDRKTVTRAWLDKIDAEALAYWIMDDGRGGPRLVGSTKDHCIELATCSFSDDENRLIVSWLKDRWGLNATVGRTSNGATTYPIIVFDMDSSRKLTELVGPYFHHTMKYKLPSPRGALLSLCVRCGVRCLGAGTGRMAWCDSCKRFRNSRVGRNWLRTMKDRCSRAITSLRHLPPAPLVDIHLKTTDERRSLIVNGFIVHNSEHVPFFVVDEVDVVRDPRAYEEAKLIPAPINGLMPITLLTSTRKISTGLVQKEIDDEFDLETGRRKLWIRHWNIIDVTERCPPERHLPMLPKIPIYVNENQVRAISEDKYNDLSPQEQTKFKKEEGFEGCLKNCRLFAACHGLLATQQKSNSKLLKPIEHTTNQIMNVSAPTALAQLLCKKPSQEGLIYPNFDRNIHMLSAADMAAKILGAPFPPNTTKRQLIEIMRARDMLCYAGMDFGFEHNFAVVTFFVDGYRAFVVDVISEAELLPDAQVAICTTRIKKWMPTIYPDPESPQMIALFRKAGFRMRDWNKGPGSVYGGINVVHMRLRPPMADEPLIFFLAGDPGVELLVKRMLKYHWKRDAADRPTNKPSDVEDDECDAFRYGIMNVFSPERGRVQAAEDVPEEKGEAPPGVYTTENWMGRVIDEAGGHSEGSQGSSGRRGRFIWTT